ncbi:MAG: binary toxin-like calcium binding domain-containing protein [bacterium]
MFDELDKQNTNSVPAGSAGSIPNKAEDIFSEVDKTVKPEALRPRDNNPLPYSSTVIPVETGWLKNKIMIFGLIFGGLIVVVGGGYFGLRLMVKSTAPVNINNANTESQQVEVDNNQAVPEIPTPSAEEINNIVSQPIQPIIAVPTDSDQDGLTDEEEVVLGTNIINPDTDQDGLTDREEVKVYGTNPLKLDTDGDGYSDGQEVAGGFNPNGPGKFLDINNIK